MKLEPGARIGPYQILGELGRGGMATVYRAYQPSLEREVALKVLPEFLIEQPGFKARFHREAVAVARLQHPNILSVFDHGEQDGVTYIVSEYVDGGTLAARMGAPIQLDYCVRILRPIADALDYAHSEGVIHRDVKPSNILVDRRGVPILSDFGLARLAETAESERLTQTGAMVGTPTYMAPEQCAGQAAGPPADIYALAVIAFEMVTGRVPFSAPTPLGVIAAHQVTPAPSPRKFNPSLPVVVEAPLLAGLAKDPAHRPQTATDFIDALGVAVSSVPMQYPLTPPPLVDLPPTPTAVEVQSPAPAAAAPPFSPPPAPPAYAVPIATTAPSTPHAAQQPAYTPARPAPPTQPDDASSTGPAVWVLVALWAGFALGVIAVVVCVVYNLFVPDISAAQRWFALLIGIVGAAVMATSLAAALGLAARDRWGPALGWTSVVLLGLSVVGAPIAAFVGWGLSKATGSLSADQRGGGGATRLTGASATGLLMVLLVAGTAAWGSANPYAVSGHPGNNTPTACTILQPNHAITPDSVGSQCSFKFKSAISQLECPTAGTSLPSGFSTYSYDFDKKVVGGGASVAVDSAGCHITAPANRVEGEMLTGDLAPGDALVVADFVPTASQLDLGIAYGCDSTGCISADLFTVEGTLDVWDDVTQFPTQKATPVSGVNRLLLAVQGKEIRVWFNGKMITTQTAGRLHGAGSSSIYLENFESAPVTVDVLRFAVYSLEPSS